jgi:ATP-grasp domain-containing protein
MRILFCGDPLNGRHPDPDYEAEASAAQAAGLDFSLINYEALVDDDGSLEAIRRVPAGAGHELGIYRGWMLKPAQYRKLFEALVDGDIYLVNTPDAYVHCHYLPEWYPLLREHTPLSVWIEADSDLPMDRIMELLQPFGSNPVVVKDFVKSRKHEWEEACYIPAASDRGSVERVVNRFLDLQGPDLAEGLVFREYVEFEPLGRHSKSGMPLSLEYRLFFLDGELLACLDYWPEADYSGSAPPLDEFREVAQKVRSRFFTMDVAKRISGEWRVVELGDGQVAGLPESADPAAFYGQIAQRAPQLKVS